MSEIATQPRFSRRGFLMATAALSATAIAGCQRDTGTAPGTASSPDAIAAAEARRPHSGRTVSTTLTAQRTRVDLGGTVADTIAYNDIVPGPLLRASVGDELAVTVRNRLGHATSVHWHGIALRNDMDGASPATPDIADGRDFTYRFSVPHPGTYWAHPHTGLDADTGLYFPVIVDDPNDPGRYDAEWVVMLDDWTDGVGPSPAQIYDRLRMPSGAGHDMPDMGDMPGMNGNSAMDPRGARGSASLGGDAGDVDYPMYVINGRNTQTPSSFRVRPGERVRIRLINAGSDTAFRVALAEHRMTVTHTDGFPVVPTEVDAVLIGMGERYDVVVTARDGVFPLVAAAEGKNASARALLVTAGGSTPPPDYAPPEFQGRLGTVGMFTATPEATFDSAPTDAELPVELGGSMSNYEWTINGLSFAKARPLTVREGQRVALTFRNSSMMWHPMHLHGHTFQVLGDDGRPGARKDTLVVLPMQQLRVTFAADNHGLWMLHCHNTYHQESGMMTSLDYAG
ncbi:MULTISPECIES: multicopper oxidase family protein [unclassified Mycolicibacterium]|uniref:multicopper oxidase family protein n=1 Tax=unclassified Mycolicibacterium TaxID=2636767 RepID=UPI0012DBDFD3|nr:MULTISPECIES: multicopper oxidase family protein [unclassified Mycolicibacterium]MUL84715.1 multicopper oxidase family protein [Mycolicibacterium sp. CBMA 329]MUL88490.1 multicopper oxidase family protein [Mycolicibacterium sp. CBMA 331]MUM00171.1 multicopper oxidase family protein [Mycolicibacterium sp. CBMA 334]MUM27835.1 multicopper oxidase family protein [Mycolicibacterium sp. CBMA 295]MUM40137.1 multicopper oxidase family protein [Mycolicibacterium sp. CBMA 247]